MDKILLRNTDIPRSETIGVYLAQGGYKALPKTPRAWGRRVPLWPQVGIHAPGLALAQVCLCQY